MSTRNELRAEYDLYRHAAWLQAEAATCGYWLSRKGKTAGIDPERLWDMPWEQAEEYASEELLGFWREHGRWTWAEYRAQYEASLPYAHVTVHPYPKTFYAPQVVVRRPDGTHTMVGLTCEHMSKWGHDSQAAALRCARTLAAQRGIRLAA